jgi:hypothetical protein
VAGSLIVYVWRDLPHTRNVAVISTEDAELVNLLIQFLPEEGYRVTIRKAQIRDVGPDD